MLKISEEEFVLFANFIKTNFGINLYKKKSLVLGRLGAMIEVKGFENFSEYLSHVLTDISNTEITELINKITTNYTFFMREEKHFHYLYARVLPKLEQSISDKDLRIWSAGCSTGEEPYTLAMIISEYFGTRLSLWNTQVLATDISVKALGIAEKGVYSFEAVKGLSEELKLKYFNKIDNKNYAVKHTIKDEVIFRVFNLMDHVYPFKKRFHVIFCRNVMIYFDSETRKRLINQLYKALEPGGYLFIGHSETIGRMDTKLRYIMPSVYKKENNINDKE